MRASLEDQKLLPWASRKAVRESNGITASQGSGDKALAPLLFLFFFRLFVGELHGAHAYHRALVPYSEWERER